MTNFIALLRGVNVSGQKKMPMADLRAMLEKLNFQNVTTYIQSGNIVFGATETDKGILEKRIKIGIQDVFGFDVPVLVKSKNDFESILSFLCTGPSESCSFQNRFHHDVSRSGIWHRD